MRSSCSFIWKNLIGSQCQCQWWWWWCVCFEVLLWFNDRVSCRRNNTVRYRLVHVYVFASKVALKMVAERHKIWNRLAAQIWHFLAHSAESCFSRQKVPFFSVSRQNRVKHCQCILNFNILSSFALSSTLPLLSFAILWSNLSLSLLFMCYELWVRGQELLISFDNHLNHCTIG